MIVQKYKWMNLTVTSVMSIYGTLVNGQFRENQVVVKLQERGPYQGVTTIW